MATASFIRPNVPTFRHPDSPIPMQNNVGLEIQFIILNVNLVYRQSTLPWQTEKQQSG